MKTPPATMSGYCEAAPRWANPSEAHARCELPGCVCTCHTPTVPDDLEPAGVQLAIPRDLELTREERRRIIAAHMILDPADALEVARQIAQERMMGT